MRRSSSRLFWKKVNKHGPRHPQLGTRCWLWIASCTVSGYGKFRYKGKTRRAHRLAYKMEHKLLKSDKILHYCDNRKCVRDSHLYKGSQQQNMYDMCAKGRNAIGSKQGLSKLTEQVIPEIRKKYATGIYSQRYLGEQYGVDQSVISEVVNKKIWSHVA